VSEKKLIREEIYQLKIAPIGTISTDMVNKFDAPHQPHPEGESTSVIELFPKQDFHKAVEDLRGFEYIWIIWWFHKNSTWRPKVRPPRGEGTKRGLFATRSPHRPNPIGISAVKLLAVDGLKITVGECDLVDGTPILDIKPYIPAVDSFPNANTGWLKDVEDFYEKEPTYLVKFSERAEKENAWLKERGVNFINRAIKILEIDPSENRTRRIKQHGANLYRMGCAEWRLFFSVNGNEVEIQYFRPGYTVEKLQADGSEVIANRDNQLAFFKLSMEQENE
jgi:tRNA-Thr(GGU) m(6)t(6)A37 methyltransferase TsaA